MNSSIYETTILFWNVHQNAVDEPLKRLINSQRVDVIILAESTYIGYESELLAVLNASVPLNAETFYAVAVPPEMVERRLQILSRIPAADWKITFTHDRYAGYLFRSNSGQQLLLATVHFPDARYDQGDGQRKTAIDLRRDLEAFEAVFLVQNDSSAAVPASILIGDFNASPFDAGIAGFYGLNASGHRDIVTKHGTRTLGGKTARFYYNLMWRFLGHPVTPGTYYDRLSAPICYDWYLLDQAIVSPELAAYISEDSIQILDRDAPKELEGESLLETATDQKPARPNAAISDHLPVMLRLPL